MNRKQDLQSLRRDVNNVREKISRLGVNSIEEKATNEVRQWRQSFDRSASLQVQQVLDDIENRKLAEVHKLSDELRVSLAEFQTSCFDSLNKLETYISRINGDEDIHYDYVRHELRSINKKFESLNINIIVRKVDGSQQRRVSTIVARNTIEITKVFEFKIAETHDVPSSTYYQSIRDFLQRASSAGARFYNFVTIRGETKSDLTST